MKAIKTFKLLQKPMACVVTPEAAQRDKQRSKPYNNRRWQAIRRMQLDREPLCRMCKAQGITAVATQVDHIHRLRWGGDNDPSNLQSLCASCHSRKTQLEARQAGTKP